MLRMKSATDCFTAGGTSEQSSVMETFPLKPCKTVAQAARCGRLDDLKRLISKGLLIFLPLRKVVPVCYTR